MNSGKPYTVSVRLMTYNHAKYIRQAMESILAQKTDFNVEVVVGDDFSTDGTLDIVREYQSTEKIHIRILERKIGDEYWTKRQKLGRLYNFINILENCTGEYIALLDGDDYWVDPFRLKKQVEFLTHNSEYVLTSANSVFIFEDEPERVEYFRPYWSKCTLDTLTTLDQIRFAPAFHISTALYRNLLREIPDFFFKTNSGDIVLFTLLSEKGLLHYNDAVYSGYRVHSAGITKTYTSYNGLVFKHRKKITMFTSLDRYFGYRYTALYGSYLSRQTKKMIGIYLSHQKYFSLIGFFITNFMNRHVRGTFRDEVRFRLSRSQVR